MLRHQTKRFSSPYQQHRPPSEQLVNRIPPHALKDLQERPLHGKLVGEEMLMGMVALILPLPVPVLVLMPPQVIVKEQGDPETVVEKLFLSRRHVSMICLTLPLVMV